MHVTDLAEVPSLNIAILYIGRDPGDVRLLEALLVSVQNSRAKIPQRPWSNGTQSCLPDDDRVDIVIAETFAIAQDTLAHTSFSLIFLTITREADLDYIHVIQTQTPTTPLIAITTLAQEDLAFRAIQRGAADYLIREYLVDMPHVSYLLVRSLLAILNQQDTSISARSTQRALVSNFSTIIEQHDDGILIVDVEGTVCFLNPAAERLLGRPIEQLLGEPFGFPIITDTMTELDVYQRGEAPRCIEMQAAETLWESESAYLIILRDVSRYKQAIASQQAIQQVLREREEYIRLITDTVPALIAYLDIHERYQFVNKPHETWFGIAAPEIEGKHIGEVIGTTNYQRVARRLAWVLAGETVTQDTTITLANGTDRYVHMTYLPHIDDQQRIIGCFLLIEDITERWHTEQEMLRLNRELKRHVLMGTIELEQTIRELQNEINERKQSEDRLLLLSTALEAAANGIVITDASGIIVWVNPAFTRLTGYTAEEAIGQHTGILKSSVYSRSFYHELWKTIRSGHVWRGELVNRRKDGRLYHEEMTITPVRDSTDTITNFIAIKQDITDSKLLEARLWHDAMHDGVTGLPNRTCFIEHLRGALAQTSQYPSSPFAVLFLDVDHFSVITNSLGHLAADTILLEVGQRIQLCLRPGDMVARFGGDEFAILLKDIADVTDARMLAERIQQSLMSTPVSIRGHDIALSASIGISLSVLGYERPEDMLRDADAATSRAKQQGRARAIVFDRAMYEAAVARLRMAANLRRAIDQRELQVYYQPIVDLQQGKTAGFEALLRWNHPYEGMIAPSDFIRVAEETGLMNVLTRFVLCEACQQMRAWHELFHEQIGVVLLPLTISVNLSIRDIEHPELVGYVGQILRDTGLRGEYLKLEITENVLMEHAELTIATLSSLRDLDIQLSIDDFGTGYSSLQYLHRFPVQTVKIDRSFVCAMNPNPESSAIVKGITMLSHALGMSVVAEGIETEDHLAQLEALGCEYGQGFFFSCPLNRSDIEAWLRAEIVKAYTHPR